LTPLCGFKSGRRHTLGIAGLDQDRGCALRRRRFWDLLTRRHPVHSIAIGWDLGKLAFSRQFLSPPVEI
jgi:hypothetical protein